MAEEQIEYAASVFVEQLLPLRAGENLLLYLDTTDDERVAQAIQNQANKKGAQTEILRLDAASDGASMSRQIAAKVRSGNYQAVCELSAAEYFYLGPAWQAVREKKARVYSIAGLDACAFVRCVGKVDHRAMIEFGTALKSRLIDSRRLRITSASGTDFQMELGLKQSLPKRAARKILRGLRRGLRKVAPQLEKRWRAAPGAYIYEPCGLLRDERESFLGGQLSFRGVPGTIDGTAVIDGYLWPPPEIGLLDRPIILKFEEGALADIGGCPVKSKMLARRLQGPPIHLEHLSVGFNPGARWSGKLLEIERIFGALTFGFGQKLLHTDGVIRRPSMIADETTIEEEGSFVAPELQALQQALMVREIPASGSSGCLGV
jgi:leucyl aminopeptidase (aminopeptidase T)